MRKRFSRLADVLKGTRKKSIAFVLIALAIAAGIAVYVGIQIHGMQKESLLLRGELNAQKATMEYNRYLLTRVDIVTMVGNKVENLIDLANGNVEIEDYLTDETNIIIATLDPDTTGLYGLINGAYLDGSGWEPDADYVASERPWYRQAAESGQQITFVDPYLDAQTNTVMMTVAKMLKDGESVLAMDVSLRPIQEIVENVSANTIGGQAFLLDGSGNVIAHSDRGELGKNYLEEPETAGGMIARRLFKDGDTQFEISTPTGNYTVYIHVLEGGWYSVSLIDSDAWHGPIHRTMFIFAAILTLIIAAIFAVFLRLTSKNTALQELHQRVDREEKRGDELQALSETDRMTGLKDRISGERKANELIRSGSGGMFLELDIDQFKHINDTWGHQTGDAVIIAVADAIRSTFRTNDVVMRLGGDEFGVFAVGIVNREMGKAMVQRLFNRIAGLNIPEMKGQKVFVSVGAAICPEGKETSFHELYAIADKALYRSKKASGSKLTFG